MQHAINFHFKKQIQQTFVWPLLPLKLTLYFCLHLQYRSQVKVFPSFLFLPCFLNPTSVRLSSQPLSFSKSKKQFSGLIFIDISAAFNKDDHSHLLETSSSVSLVFFSSLLAPFISLADSSLFLPNLWTSFFQLYSLTSSLLAITR